jgi:toxin ParE2
VTVRFLRAAEIELEEAIRFFEAQRPGLGTDFLLEVMSTLHLIASFPEGWQRLDENIRRCRLRRCPYGLVYMIEDGDVLIVAVSHVHRRPDHWRDRLTR